MSADSAAVSTSAAPAPAAVTPVPESAAFAILGSMILLILALTAVLVRTTWGDAAESTEVQVVEAERLAGR